MGERPDEGGESRVGPQEWAAAMVEFAERSQRILSENGERLAREGALQIPDPTVVTKAFLELATRFQADPVRAIAAQLELWQRYAELWQATIQRLSGQAPASAVEPETTDRRFKDQVWDEDAVFSFIKQAYLVAAQWMQNTARHTEGLDPKTAEKVDFYTRQVVDALAPSNFAATHPKVWDDLKTTGGKHLLHGMRNLLKDMERGKGRLAISMTDMDAFEVGRNLATTPGQVIYQNELTQLIQYLPTTETVHRRPLLIVPPWINKFYILDLQPKNSFIRWAVEQGHTVFVISWVNPDETLAHKSFEDYMREGPLEALGAIERATGEREVNAIGYCIGGTLLASTLAYLASRGDDRIQSATFFTTMVDFSEIGELSVFIDDEQLHLLDRHMAERGYLDGRYMATVFNLLRDNDLIWSFVVNNYLMGRDPRAFDLLYWNSDSTRMPAMMHSFYLRKMYLENKLVEPGGICLLGVPIDLRTVKIPVYILSTREDHIAPWKSTYAATQIYSGPVKFVLGASGHIAGAINPPAANKYAYWTNARKPKSPDTWLAGAQEHPGSWWPDWDKWVRRRAGGHVPARSPGSGDLQPIEDAPGSYVKVKVT
jgi:polyhydroxyalkanoate synthase